MAGAARGPDRLVPVLLFACAGLVLSVVSYGELSTIDARIMLDAARHVAAGEGFVVDPAIGIPGADGRYHAYYAPANSLVMLPLVAAARAATTVVSLPLPIAFLEEFLSAMAGAWLKAMGVVLVYAVLDVLDPAPRRNVIAALGVLFMGFDFQYGRSYFAETPAAACLLLATYGLLANRTSPAVRHLLLTGSALALATAFRWEMVVFVPVFAIVAWRHGPATSQLRVNPRSSASAAAFAVPLVLMALVLGAYNTSRFGAFWKTGYERLPLPASPVEGWLGLLFSPGAGLLWFAPWCVSLVVLVRMRAADNRRFRDLCLLVAALVVVACLLYGSWSYWAGGLAWGPRFLVPLVPLLSVLAVLVWRRHAMARRIGLPLGAACVVMNLLLVIAPHERLHAYGLVRGWTETQRIWSPWSTPWLHQPRMAVDVARNLPHVRGFAARARERLTPRSQPRLPGEIDMADALHNSVSLNVPAVWWVKLLLMDVPAWAPLAIGLAGLAGAAILAWITVRRAGLAAGEGN